MAHNKPEEYVISRGRFSFAEFATGTKNIKNFAYLGNAPSFTFSIESETYDHYNSTGGSRQKDLSVPIETVRTGTLTLESVYDTNLAMFLGGSVSKITQTAATYTDQPLDDVVVGNYYVLGATTANPFGHRKLDIATPVVVKRGATALTVDVDYTVDYDLGEIRILQGTEGEDLTVTYTTKATTFPLISSGTKTFTGKLRFEGEGNTGKQISAMFNECVLTSNGDMEFITEEVLQMQFNVEVLKPTSQEAVVFLKNDYS